MFGINNEPISDINALSLLHNIAYSSESNVLNLLAHIIANKRQREASSLVELSNNTMLLTNNI